MIEIPNVPANLQDLARITMIRHVFEEYLLAGAPEGHSLAAFRKFAVETFATIRSLDPASQAMTPAQVRELLEAPAYVQGALEGALGFQMRNLIPAEWAQA